MYSNNNLAILDTFLSNQGKKESAIAILILSFIFDIGWWIMIILGIIYFFRYLIISLISILVSMMALILSYLSKALLIVYIIKIKSMQDEA